MTYRALSTELEGNLLEVGLCGSLQDVSSSNRRASEGDLVDTHMACNSSASVLSITVDQVDGTRWETGFLDQLTHVQSVKRSCLSSLDDYCVSAGESWSDLPGEHEEREANNEC